MAVITIPGKESWVVARWAFEQLLDGAVVRVAQATRGVFTIGIVSRSAKPVPCLGRMPSTGFLLRNYRQDHEGRQ